MTRMRLFPLIAEAFSLWWRDAIALIPLNFVWLLLQLPIITGPPATAVVFVIAQRIHKDEVWEPKDGARLFRRLFWPAWRWALLNILFWLATAVNFSFYQERTGVLWLALRLLWGLLALVWALLNFFYWPFWLEQEDRSMRNTYANCARFLLLHPFTAVGLGLFAAVLALISIPTTLPAGLALMVWLALLAVTAVRQAL